MSFPPVAGDEFFAWRRQEFPFFAHKIFLTHASVSPLPARSGAALGAYIAQASERGQFDDLSPGSVYHRCKQRIAALLGESAHSDEIAFAGSTSHALGLVATSLDWKAGENCVVFDGDFPANVVIWKNLAPTRGVEVRVVPYRPSMVLSPDDLAPFVDERTRIVTLSAVNFLSGSALDLRAFGQWLHARGVLLCVDGIQALGALILDLSEVDFVCADAHKWMLGPNGTAFVWMRGAVMEQMRPQILGWLAVANRENWFAYDTTPFPTAERFEPGARNTLGIVATEASLALLQNAGLAEIETRVTALRDYAARKLQEAGCTLLWTPTPGSKGGIVTFQPPRGDTAALFQKLEEQFALSLRKGYDGADWIRVSPHFMNCERDLDELAEAITTWLQ